MGISVSSWIAAIRCHRPRLLAAAFLLLALGCGGDTTTPSQPVDPATTDEGPFLVSNAIVRPSAAGTLAPTGMQLAASAVLSVVYVSLPPGSIPGATSATISAGQAGAGAVITIMTDGGFDPLPIAAEVGDTIAIKVQGAVAAAKAVYRVPVRPKSRPVVVRTAPPPHKRDVPLNYLIQVVFSEPMDSASLGTAVRLRAGAGPVAGEVRSEATNGVILQATFVPATSLVPGTDYQLNINTTARDAGGDALEAPVSSDFTTVAATPAAPSSNANHPSVSLVSPGPGDTIAGEYVAFRLHTEAPLGLASISWVADSGPAREFRWGQAKRSGGDALVQPLQGLSLGTHVLQMVVTDAAGQVATSEPVTVVVAEPDTTRRLVVRSFEVLEMGEEGSWLYAPQLVVAEAPGGSGLTILAFDWLTLPGLDPWLATVVTDLIPVPPGQNVPLIREVYGDWEIGAATGERRSTGGTATFRITYQDDRSHVYVNTLQGPIVPGTRPATYSGTCSHLFPTRLFDEPCR